MSSIIYIFIMIIISNIFIAIIVYRRAGVVHDWKKKWLGSYNIGLLYLENI